MNCCPDTSFLCALYRRQVNSPQAAEMFAAMTGPLEVTTLLPYEFRQSVRFQIRLHVHDAAKGFPKAYGVKALADLRSDLASGAVSICPAPWHQIHGTAERLSDRYTVANGHRSMDILHVATALETGARTFLTFDANQRKLAEAEGLHVPLK